MKKKGWWRFAKASALAANIAIGCSLLWAGTAFAWGYAQGNVYCDTNGNGQIDPGIDDALAGVEVNIAGATYFVSRGQIFNLDNSCGNSKSIILRSQD